MYDLNQSKKTYCSQKGKFGTPSRPDTVNTQTDTSCRFANHSTILQGIVDSLDGIVFHANQET